MDDYRVGFLKMFNERNNVDPPNFYIGKIVSLDPLKISIADGQAYFTEGDNLKVCETLKNINGNIVLDSVSEYGSIATNFTITRNLNIDDEILCFPLDSSNFIAFDKV